MQYIGSLEAAEKHIFAEIFKENLHTSVDTVDLYGSSRFSATIFTEPCRSAQIRKDQKPRNFTAHCVKTLLI